MRLKQKSNKILTKEIQDSLQDFYESPDDLPPQVGWKKNQIIAVRDQYAFVNFGSEGIVLLRRSNTGDPTRPKVVWSFNIPDRGKGSDYTIKKVINKVAFVFMQQCTVTWLNNLSN